MARLTSHADIYTESLRRCLERPGFIDRFYELFLASSEEVRRKFENTDFAKQRTALKRSLYAAIFVQQRSDAALAELERVARRHGRAELDVPPALYELWLASLLATAREWDPGFTDETAEAWRSILRPMIQFITDRY